MHNLYEPSRVAELRQRLARLQSDSRAHWGKMTVSQAMAHCAAAFENALGDKKPARMFIGRIIGPLIKRLAIGDDKPIKRNSPTAPALIITDERDFDSERRRLDALIARFAAEGAQGCTRHPHTFFGRMTPDEWAVLMYKHTDHHLRQFGV